MGYRSYIVMMSIEEYEKFSPLKNINEVYKHIYSKEYEEDNGDYLSGHDLFPNRIEVSANTEPVLGDEGTKPFFKEEIKHQFETLMIIDKTILLKIIKGHEEVIRESYRDEIEYFFNDDGRFKDSILKEPLVSNNEVLGKIYDLILFVSRKAHEVGAWSFFGKDTKHYNSVLNLDTNEPYISNSSHYEYDIFNLVYLYKHYDWDKNIMIFVGW